MQLAAKTPLKILFSALNFKLKLWAVHIDFEAEASIIIVISADVLEHVSFFLS